MKLNHPLRIAFLCLSLLLSACMRWDYGLPPEEFHLPSTGLFISNEGNFQYGNATLSFYDPTTNSVENELFFRANGMKLGDVAQSIAIALGKVWIVVNNSHVIFAVDPVTCREVGRIEGLTSPRYIHFISPTKAYVTQLWDNRIAVVNPQTFQIIGHIPVPNMPSGIGSTEQMLTVAGHVVCNCWSYQDKIIKIDPATDKVLASLRLGPQPNSMALDSQNRLWVLTDGGADLTTGLTEPPALFCVNPVSFQVEHCFNFPSDASPSRLCATNGGNTLLWLNSSLWSMDISSSSLPSEPLVEARGTKYYGLTVSPHNGEIYLADAIDYQQQGIIRRFSPTGEPIGQFYAGINPGAFCWKN